MKGISSFDAIEVEREAWVDAIEKFVRIRPLSRRRKARYTLAAFARAIRKHPHEVSRPDLEGFFESLKGRYRPWTIHDYKLISKQFYRRLKGKKFVEWIKIPRSISSSLGPEDILQKEVVDKMASVCDNLRDKALVPALFELKCRPSEFLSLWKHNVTFDENGALVHIPSTASGKTKDRTIRVVECSARLAEWIENHPIKEDSPLWVNLSTNGKYEALKQQGLRRLLKKVAEKADVQKRVFPYLMRHSGLTYLVRMKISEPILRNIAGWTMDSRMPATYLHIASADSDDAILQMHGLKSDRAGDRPRVPVKCSRCGILCAPDQERCHKCGIALSLEVAIKSDEQKEKGKAMLEWKVDMLGRAVSLLLKRTLQKEGDVELAKLTEEERRILGTAVFSKEVDLKMSDFSPQPTQLS